ncbi:ATP-binding protein [Dyadobacter chenhuakuii]|uniref:histidine kinase n=1 Tax=Dyadobacter chenhuakuii TaxID=2909339 RepID=A0ABY4XPK0_9BACT|nr:ATP-binding protein [Dyadobacter chenhuakuii]MCF2494665.1 histidine kinase [Dyadobacter chenhuakuii]USJ32013.1 histidine kinase [Dyadobacter chenhuakuii]
MERLDKSVASSLTRFYIVALCVVAMLTISGLFLIRRTINNLNHDSRMVNVAGRQRMLSQRLTKLAILNVGQIKHSDSAQFDSLLTIWKESHENLANKKLPVENGLVTWKSAALDSMFLDLMPVFDSIYTNFSLVNDSKVAASAKAEALNLILDKEPLFLAKMDKIVFQFDKESFQRLENLERIEWILDIMTILVLFAEGLLIFRPVVNTTRRVVRMLTESENALQLSNQKLKEANHQLLEAQNDLLRVEEEKYELQLAEDRIRASALIEGQEEERKRFALELHDGIGQMLTGLKLHAEKLKSVQFHDQKNQKRFEQLVTLIQDIIQTTRQISFNLMPSVLSDFGLSAALRLLCEQTAELSGIKIEFDGDAQKRVEMGRPTEIGLYRIAQEALNNAVKHANADKIKIKLEQNKNRIILEIADDGKGFLISNLKSEDGIFLTRNGMENIRTRTQLLNGEMEIVSEVDSGTQLIVRVDL